MSKGVKFGSLRVLLPRRDLSEHHTRSISPPHPSRSPVHTNTHKHTQTHTNTHKHAPNNHISWVDTPYTPEHTKSDYVPPPPPQQVVDDGWPPETEYQAAYKWRTGLTVKDAFNALKAASSPKEKKPVPPPVSEDAPAPAPASAPAPAPAPGPDPAVKEAFDALKLTTSQSKPTLATTRKRGAARKKGPQVLKRPRPSTAGAAQPRVRIIKGGLKKPGRKKVP